MRVKRFILKWIWVLPLLVWFALTVQAGLSDETQELVEDLRWKHYGYSSLYATSDTIFYDPVDYTWTSIWFEDGVLYIKTQDGTWFVEMQRKEE